MARLEYFVVSESASIDQTTNQTSIFNISEEVKARSFPCSIAQCVALSLWRPEPGDDKMDFQILLRIKASGAKLQELASNFRFKSDATRHRVLMRIAGVPLAQPGELVFELLLNGKHAAEHIVSVIKADPIDIVAATLEAKP